jgi:hypothetical protein
MRKLLFTLTVLTAANLFGVTTPSRAATACLAGGENGALQCDYASLDQCRATAAGGLGYCVTNRTGDVYAYAGLRRPAMVVR